LVCGGILGLLCGNGFGKDYSVKEIIKMKVKKLIEELQKHDPEKYVWLSVVDRDDFGCAFEYKEMCSFVEAGLLDERTFCFVSRDDIEGSEEEVVILS
jgi:hypothetical protein